MNKVFKVFLVMGLTLFVMACSNFKTLSKTDRKSISRICLMGENEVEYPENVIFLSHAEGFKMGIAGGLGGAAGVAMYIASANPASQTEEHLIQDYLQSGPNTLSNKLIEGLSRKIAKNTSFVLDCSEQKDADLKFTILTYGISYVPLSLAYRPFLAIEGKLFSVKNKEVLWKYRKYVYADMAVAEKHRKEKLFSDKDLMKQEFAVVGEHIFEGMTSHLSGKNTSYMSRKKCGSRC